MVFTECMSNTTTDTTTTTTTVSGYSDDQVHVTGSFEIHVDAPFVPVTFTFDTGQRITITWGRGWEIAIAGTGPAARLVDHSGDASAVIPEGAAWCVVEVAGHSALVHRGVPTGVYYTSRTDTFDAGPLGE